MNLEITKIRPLYWVITVAASFIALGAMAIYKHLYPFQTIDPTLFSTIYVPLEVLEIFICANIFVIRFVSGKFGVDLQSLIIGNGFLIAAIMFTFRLLGNIVLSGFTSMEVSNEVLYFRTIARFSVIVSLGIASLAPDEKIVSVKRLRLLTATSLLSLILSAVGGVLIFRFGTYLPKLFTRQEGATLLAGILGYAMMIVEFLISFRFGKMAVRKNDLSFFAISVATALLVPTEYAFAIIKTENSVFKLIGTILAAVGFILIFYSLVQLTLTKPYKHLNP